MVIGEENILYNDKINFYWIKEIKEALNKDTLYDWKHGLRYEKHVLPDSLTFVLTASERSFINQELDKMNTLAWKDNLLKHSILITKQKLQQYRDLHGGQSYYESQEYKKFHKSYTFTKPIFIRNNTVCFFYLAETYGGNLMIYIKDGKKWKLKYIPYFWTS
ncbi:hypothetical protein GCM10022392_19810 [Mucilaginibacter panaciglaebae]|uniref:Uncharacterized protein n=2 Tax=Mucilaginibacter panaciglaebae TaxID=502331 RepID=A0ABP7WTQ7_9SPHI